MHNPSKANLTVVAVGCLAALALAAGCHDFGGPRASRGAAVDSGAIRLAHARLLAALTSANTFSCTLPASPPSSCGVTFTAVPANSHSPAQQDPITVTFSQPIYQLTVWSSGTLSCSGAYGRVTAYNRTYRAYGGWQVEQRDFILYDPSDCGDDNVTCCTVDTLQFPGGVSKVVIDPPQPWSYPVYDETGYVQLGYFYWFNAERAPTAPCPTGDELLDQQAMRDLLAEAWLHSNVTDMAANRRERGGMLFEDSAGSLIYRLYPDTPVMDTPCSNVSMPSFPYPGLPVAEGHTHPFAPRDTLPQNCPQTKLIPPGKVALYDTTKFGGPSGGDVDRVGDDSLPTYIVDKNNIYAAPLGISRSNSRSVMKAYPRTDPVTGCVRI